MRSDRQCTVKALASRPRRMSPGPRHSSVSRAGGQMGRTQRTARGTAPIVDEYGVMRIGGELVVLGPIEGRLAALLFDHAGSVVTFDDLLAAGWPQARPTPNAFHVWVARLRKRLGPFGVSILTVRGRGLLLMMTLAMPVFGLLLVM